MHLFVIPTWFNCLFFVGVAALAIWRAGWRERTISIAQALDMVFTSYICGMWSCPVQLTGPPAHLPPHPPMIWRPVVDDGLVLILCLICVVRADRYWIILASSFALLGAISDLAVLVPGVSIWAFISASLAWSYCVAFAVLWGVLTFKPVQTALSPRGRINAGSAP